jgi:pimeloyl-ACP methyl ester carboxylesterase
MSGQTIEILGLPLEFRHVPPPPGAPTLVFLHEALGSLAQWRDFPERLAAATGLGWMAYSRQGHGHSAPFGRPRDFDYLDHEAIDVLPALLRATGITRPILFGHSDGATIALIHAASTSEPLAGLILEAPHIMVEDVSVAGVADTVERARTGDMIERMGKYHARPAPLFEAWRSIWLDPGFRGWSIEHRLSAIVTPILQFQGADDPYGTERHVAAIAEHACAPVETVMLDRVGHTPHLEAPEQVIAASKSFIAALLDPA